MIRLGFAFGAALTLTACVSGDRVTLLSHSDGGPVGSVAVLAEEGAETVLDQENQQVRLSRSGPRVRLLEEVDPKYQELIGGLPQAPSALTLDGFPSGAFSLSDAQKDSIRQHFNGLESRPGYQIEIRAYADSVGGDDINVEVSQGRAEGAAAIIRELGFGVDAEDVIGMGEFEAARKNGDEVPDPSFRRVDVVIR